MDRRRHERFDLEALVKSFWQDRAGTRYRGQGLARDISAGGLFVLTHDLPPLEVDVRLEVFFRSFLAGSRLALRINSRVVRVEKDPRVKERDGFAVAVKTFMLRNDDGEVLEQGRIIKGPSKAVSKDKKKVLTVYGPARPHS